MPDFKGSCLGRFPLVSADFWTGDHLSERPRSLGACSGTRARGTLTLKRRRITLVPPRSARRRSRRSSTPRRRAAASSSARASASARSTPARRSTRRTRRRTRSRPRTRTARAPRPRGPGQEPGDSTSRAFRKTSIHASRALREMIARPRISRNEWAERGARARRTLVPRRSGPRSTSSSPRARSAT